MQSPVVNENLGYDQSGNITSINDNKFSYDGLNRLVKAELPSLSQTESYSYDPTGNRTEQTINGETLAYNYNSVDELVSMGDTTFTYDVNGNTTSKTVAGAVYGYEFDSGNRLMGVTLNGNVISRYSYDADGVRVKKEENGSTTVYVNSGLQYLMTITDGVPVKHIFAQGSRVARVVNGETFYIHTDHLGNTRALTDAQGKLVASLEYSPFGTVIKSEGSDDIMKFTGKELDSSGLYYFGARYYDAGIGRFISRDPVLSGDTDPTSHNPYVYAQNSPLNLVDPDGKFLPLLLGIAAAVAGIASLAVDSYLLTGAAVILGTASFMASAWLTYQDPSPENQLMLGVSTLGLIPGGYIGKAALSGWETAAIGVSNLANTTNLAYYGAQAASGNWGPAMSMPNFEFSIPSYSYAPRMDFSYPTYNYATPSFSSSYLSTGFNSNNFNNYYGYDYSYGYNYNYSYDYSSNYNNYPQWNYGDFCNTFVDPYTHTWRYW